MRLVGAVFLTMTCGAASARAAELTLSAQAGYYDVTNARSSARLVFDGASGGPTFRLGARLRFQEHLMVAVTSGYFSHAGRKARHCHLTCFDVEEESQFRMVPVTAVLGLSGRGQWRPYGGIGGGAAYVYDRPWYYERAAAEWVSP